MRPLASLALMPLLTGCWLTGDRIDPAIDIPPAYVRARAAARRLPAPDWWRGFRSRELTGLVELAYSAISDIAAAVARIEQADHRPASPARRCCRRSISMRRRSVRDPAASPPRATAPC